MGTSSRRVWPQVCLCRESHLSPPIRVGANEHMIRNLFLTSEELASGTAEGAAAQHRSLNLLAKVVSDKCIAPNYLFAEQGGAGTIANAIYCTWINVSGEAEIQLHKTREQVHWLQRIFAWHSTVLGFVQLATFRPRVMGQNYHKVWNCHVTLNFALHNHL